MRVTTGCGAPRTRPRESMVVSAVAPVPPACPGHGHRALTGAVRGVQAPLGRTN